MKSLVPLLAVLFTPLLGLAADYPTLGHVDRLDPALDQLIAPDAKIEKLCEGFTWCEGPVWKDGALLFSDVPENIIYRWKEGDTKAAIFLTPSGMLTPTAGFREQGSNGLVLDPQGELVICEHGERRLARLGADRKTQTPVVDHFEGKRFNSPNDAAICRNGDIYFTDPPYGLDKLNDSPLKRNPVQRRLPLHRRWQSFTGHQGSHLPERHCLFPRRKNSLCRGERPEESRHHGV